MSCLLSTRAAIKPFFTKLKLPKVLFISVNEFLINCFKPLAQLFGYRIPVDVKEIHANISINIICELI